MALSPDWQRHEVRSHGTLRSFEPSEKGVRGVRRGNVGDDFWECVKIATWLNLHVLDNCRNRNELNRLKSAFSTAASASNKKADELSTFHLLDDEVHWP